MIEYLLKDISSKIGSGATPTGGKESYKGGRFSLIRSQNVLDMAFSYEGLAHINDEQAHKLDGVEVCSRDILFNITGDSICRCCIVPDDVLPARVNQHVAIIRTPNVDSRYVMYYLQYLKPYLMKICGGGSSRNALTKENLEALTIPIPNNAEKIANVLSTIDLKIKNNNTIISELESMSKDIYDYWFVQFDFPDENGKPYKSSGGKMVWNKELKKEIPEGWKACELSEIGRLSNRSIIPSSGTLYEHYSIPAFDENHYPAFEDGSFIESGKYVVERNSVLVSKLNPQFPRVWNPLMLSDKAICSTEFLVLVPVSLEGKAYLYRLMKSSVIEKAMISMATCSTGSRKRVQPEACMSIKIVKPSDSVIGDFNSIINPLIEKQKECEKENAELKSLRDWLLPMLMNGQVKVGGVA